MVCLKINSQVINDIQLVIFDKDGTLIDLYTYWANMVDLRVSLAHAKLGFDKSYFQRIMYAMGVDVENKKLRSEGPVGIKKREVVMQAMVDELAQIGFKGTFDICSEIFNKADELSHNDFPRIVKPIGGLHELLGTLNRKKCKIAIATTDKTERAKLALKFLGILDKIDTIIGGDMVSNCKPAADMVNVILEKLNVDKEKAVMVGDTITDIQMGSNSGLKASIGVCSGLTSKKLLLNKTNYVIEDISKIEVC